jgi:membrane protein implicated in regulation of membrane protease activity
MLTLYILCLVIGGVFVALAALAGLDGVDFDSDFDPDIELRDQSNNSNNNEHSPFRRSRSLKLGLPFLSLRFWTFGGCFFGLTGVILSFLTPTLSTLWIAIIAIIMGAFCGTAMVWTLRSLRKQQANSLVSSQDLLGLVAVVELPFDCHSKGKVRIAVKGSTVELMALTTDDYSFNPGDKVFVVGRENNKVWVVSEQAFGKLPN